MSGSYVANLLSLWALSLLLAFAFRRSRRIIRFAMLVAAGATALLAAICLVSQFTQTQSSAAALRRVTPAAGAFLSAAAIPQLAAWALAWIRRDLPRLAAAGRRHAAWTLATLGLFAAVTAGCLWLGSQLADRRAFDEYDTLFFADPPRYMSLMQSGAVTIDAAVYKHPLFALIASAICRPAMRLLSPAAASVFVSAFFAGLAAALAMQYFRLILGRCDVAFGLAATLAMTPAHLLFGSVPETYAMSAAGLVALHLLVAVAMRANLGDRPLAGLSAPGRIRQTGRRPVLHSGPLPATGRCPVIPLRWAAPAALLAIGATATHLVTALICVPPLRDRRRRRAARWAATLLLCGVAGLALQHGVSSDLAPAGSPAAMHAEEGYVTTATLRNPAATTFNVARAIAAESLVGPSIRIERDNLGRRGVRMGSYFTPLQRLALGGAWTLALALLIRILRHAHYRRPTFRAAAACLAFSAVLHLFYGNNHVFLFSCTYTFCTLAIFAHGLIAAPRILLFATALVALLVVSDNVCFIAEVLGRS
ncbi:hypothetical protein RAS1_29640 [Phycisphaerae bacterium RAS1]|nr:hypothetical protein RAS1_29640 [Phycisphaerae bacterium RAS1]